MLPQIYDPALAAVYVTLQGLQDDQGEVRIGYRSLAAASGAHPNIRSKIRTLVAIGAIEKIPATEPDMATGYRVFPAVVAA